MTERSLTGCFATSKAGHDKDKLYVIVAQEGDTLYLCDGRLKRFDSPKKKSRKHIQPIHTTIRKDLLERLLAGEALRDEEIKYEIKQYSGSAE